MALSPLDVAQNLSIATLVKFTWGSFSARYALWTTPIVLSGETYEALPTMAVNYGEQHGGTKDEPITIQVPDSINPIKFMLLRKWFPVRVEVYECDPLNPAATSRMKFKGRIEQTSAARGQNGRVVTLKVAGLKSALEVRLGLIVIDECQWTFGDRICRKDLTSLTESGRISGVQDTFVFIGGLSPRADKFWNRGVVTVDGYSIGIRSWTSGEVFNLFRLPPLEWVGQPCTVVAGCDKTISDCRTKWANESRFGAIGTKVLDYNPQAEIPG